MNQFRVFRDFLFHVFVSWSISWSHVYVTVKHKLRLSNDTRSEAMNYGVNATTITKNTDTTGSFHNLNCFNLTMYVPQTNTDRNIAKILTQHCILNVFLSQA